MSEYNCVKCEGKMEAGYIPDFSYGRVMTPAWRAGEPKRSWLGGLSIRGNGMPITTYRCEGCGYLESFAWPEES